MEKTVFIQSNASQYLGALLSKYSIERSLPSDTEIRVHILHVEKIPAFTNFVGKTYAHGSEERTYSLDDEQSFTLTRFMGPEQSGYTGRSIAIDPDVFAVQDISPLFEINMQGHKAACCSKPTENGSMWDTSVLLTENSKLDWSISNILKDLSDKKVNYNFVMRKVLGADVLEIPRKWNNLDEITDETRMVHMTRQRTQPWKTGLPFKVTPRDMGKLFGIIPKKWLNRDKYPSHYQEHPDSRVKEFFFSLVRDAVAHGAVPLELVKKEIAEGHIRPDLPEKAGMV